MKFMATPPVNGDLSELIVYPQDFLFPIPDNMSYEIATLNEPFSVSIHTAQLLEIKPGSSVFISGGGPVGLLAILAARTFGAKQIIVSDTQALRLSTAKKMGADRVINALEEDPRDVIPTLTNGEGVDFVIEASGNPKAERTALRTLKRGGKLGADHRCRSAGYSVYDGPRDASLRCIPLCQYVCAGLGDLGKEYGVSRKSADGFLSVK
jgi:L-iditol 2-dehydrogenase